MGETEAPDETLIWGDFSSAELEDAEVAVRVGDEKVKGKEDNRSCGWTWSEFMSKIVRGGDMPL